MGPASADTHVDICRWGKMGENRGNRSQLHLQLTSKFLSRRLHEHYKKILPTSPAQVEIAVAAAAAAADGELCEPSG